MDTWHLQSTSRNSFLVYIFIFLIYCKGSSFGEIFQCCDTMVVGWFYFLSIEQSSSCEGHTSILVQVSRFISCIFSLRWWKLMIDHVIYLEFHLVLPVNVFSLSKDKYKRGFTMNYLCSLILSPNSSYAIDFVIEWIRFIQFKTAWMSCVLDLLLLLIRVK